MNQRITHKRRGKDYASEELVAALLVKGAYTFNELFQTVNERLRARKVSGSGEEMLRLRVYERLQTFVGQGLVRKADREYAAVPGKMEALAAEMAAAKAFQEKRRREAVATE